jgi:hypothetical protein
VVLFERFLYITLSTKSQENRIKIGTSHFENCQVKVEVKVKGNLEKKGQRVGCPIY